MSRGRVLGGSLILLFLAQACSGSGGGVSDGDVSPPTEDAGVKDVPVVVDVQADPGADVPALLDVEDDEDGVGARCTEEDNEPCTITNEHGSCVGEIVCLGERGLAP